MTPRRPTATTGPWLYAGPPAAASRPHGVGGRLPAAVLFDRDGTLVADVPYNGDPARVEPMPTARAAVDEVRARGVPVGVVSNQSGVARGLLTRRQVEMVQRRVEEVLGPFEVWAVCPHGPDEGCGCRKPAPGLVLAACARLGAPVERTVVIGDIGADMGAAEAAGARGVLVPTPTTRPEETAAAACTAPDLLTAVRLALAPGSAADSAAHPLAPDLSAPDLLTPADEVRADTARASGALADGVSVPADAVLRPPEVS